LGQTVQAVQIFVQPVLVLLKKDFSKFACVSLIPEIFPKGGRGDQKFLSLEGEGTKFFKISRGRPTY